jgi:acyl-CoA thioesterase FadM
MDEAMGSLLFQNDSLHREAKSRGLIPENAKGFTGAATAYMDVKYRRPLPTPQIAFVTATLERIEGRKIHMCATVKDKDGRECVSCTGGFTSFPSDRL